MGINATYLRLSCSAAVLATPSWHLQSTSVGGGVLCDPPACSSELAVFSGGRYRMQFRQREPSNERPENAKHGNS